MKRRKLQMTMVAVVFAMLLGGCAEEAYTLTEKEEDLIVNYSAHVVTKYNTYQKEGLTYVWPEDTEATEDEQQQPVTPDATQQGAVDTTLPEASTEVVEVTEIVYAPNTATLTELFGGSGVELDFIGVRLANTYVDDAYMLYPEEGKQYFVVGIDITNAGQANAQVDYLSKDYKYEIVLNDDVRASSETTLLMQDFSTFEAILTPGETQETILLFQIPKTLTSISKLDIIVTGEESYQIILEND